MPKSSRFNSFFPPPEYLTMPSVGINISDHAIKMMELFDVGERFMLGSYETILLEKGVVEGGKLLKPESVIDILRDLKKRFKLNFIRASIPEEEGYIFSLTLSGIEQKDIVTALEYRISDHVPLNSHETVFDYGVIQKKQSSIDVNIAVLPRSVVDSHIYIYEKAGLVPLSLEIEAQTTARSVIPSKSELTLAVVDIGRTRTGFSIADKQIVRYTSTIELGGDTFVKLLADAESMSKEDAENLKNMRGIIPFEYSSSTLEKIDRSLDSLSDELLRQIDFWNHQVQKNAVTSHPVSGVILCGGNATVPGMREALAARLSLPVTIGNVWCNAFSLDEYIPPIDFNYSLGYASAIGLALMN
jgi:type IV pilus assembly protein PilM